MATIEELILGQTPLPEFSDPEAAAREQSIWDKINRGPRERADELTAKGWKDRYGVDTGSGKLKRGFAALGEIGRTISQRNNKNFLGIADEAEKRGMEEYKAEVPVLQRELGVMSQAKTAAAKMQQKAIADRMAIQVKAYAAEANAVKTGAQATAIEAKYPEEVKKLAAQYGLITAQKDLTEAKNFELDLTNEALASTGGFKLDPKGQRAAGVGFLSRNNPGEATTLMDTFKAFEDASAKGAGAGSGEKQTVRVPIKRPVTGWDAQGRPHTTYVDDEKVYRERVPGGDGVDTSLQTYPWEKKAVAPLPPSVAPQAAAPGDKPDQVTVRTVNGSEYASTPNPNKPKFSNGVWKKPIHDSQIARLSSLMDIDKSKFANWESDRYPDSIGPPIKAPSSESLAHRAYERSLRDLSRATGEEFVNNNLGNIGGLVDNFINTLKSFTGDIPQEAINIRQLSTDAAFSKILAMSGKATTQFEMKTHMKNLPNIAADHPSVIVFKAMQLKHMLDLRQMFDELRFTDKDIDNFYQTRAGNALAAMPKATFDKMEELRQLQSGSKSSIMIGGKEFKSVEKAAAEIKAGMSRTFINQLMKQALKESNITDAIPLN